MKNESYGNVLPHCCVCSLLLLLFCVFVVVVAFCNLLAASRLFVCICVCACVCVFCACLCVTYPVCCLSVPVCACVCGLRLLSVVSVVWCRVLLLLFLFLLRQVWIVFLSVLSLSLLVPAPSLYVLCFAVCLCVLLQHNSCSFVSPMIFWFLRVACVRRPSPSRPAWLAACLCACLHCLPERDGAG